MYTVYGSRSDLPGGESASVLSKDLLNLEPPLDNPGYAPVSYRETC